MPKDELPSLDDFTENPVELPSVDEFITEEKVVEELPSVEEYVVDIEEALGCIPNNVVEDLPSVEDKIVDESLPTIEDYIEEEEIVVEEEDDIEITGGVSFQDYSPEMQFRDYEFIDIIKRPEWKELVGLVNEVRDNIPDIPEIKYYDDDLEKISETIEELRSEIPVVPEVKYYDEEIDQVKQTISDLPEVKYYDQEVSNLEESFSELKEFVSNIPNYDDELNSLRDKFNYEIQQFSENVEVKDFDKKVEIDNLKTDLKETSEKIYEELKKSSDQIHEYRLHLKDDDRKLKKQILGQYNLLKENIEKKVKEFNTKNIESQNVITGSLKEYFDELQEKISAIPEVKYYDEQIEELNHKFDIGIKEIREIVDQIKETQKQDLQENLLTEPPDTDNEDPLTPLDQKFVTYERLQENYQLFVNRVQQQLASFGGGGETKLQYLDDIVGIATNLSAYDGMYLKLDTSQPAGKNFVFETVASAGAGGTWGVGSAGISTTKNVGIGTTAKSDYALDVEGNARITGIVTVGRSTITLNPNTNVVTVGTGITLDSTNNQILIGGSKVADSSGDADYTGIITASRFVGPLTGDITGDVTGNADSATILETARSIGGVSFNGSANINLPGVNQSGTQDTSGNAATATTLGSSSSVNTSGIITASEFKGNITGDVTGDVSGNITGSACTITTGNFTNVTIGGTLTYEDVTNIDSVGLITARSGVDFGSSGIVRIESVSSTKTSTSQASIDTFDAETWQSGSYQIQIRRGTAYHVTSLNLVHSGGTVYMTEYGTIKTGVSLATFDSDINSGNVRILATPSSSDSTVFKMSRTLITS